MRYTIDGNAVAACQNIPVNAAGQTQCTVSGLTLGAHTVVADYTPDSNFFASSGSMTQDVDTTGTTITITGDSPDPSEVGQPYTVTYTIDHRMADREY